MRRLIITLTSLALPFSVLALDYTDSSTKYTDAPFTLAERAAISVLTNLEVVQGYPDGTFKPRQPLNRAEFLKIVMASHPHVRVSPSDQSDCFPDVKSSDWFSPYVCLAKVRGIVGGYPDGTFRPTQNVNYAEALKMLTVLYGYNTAPIDDEEWFLQYVRLAENHGTALPINLTYDAYLTRGQMARLATLYRAYHDNELDLYKLAEESISDAIDEQAVRNGTASSSSSSSSSSSIASSISSSSSVSSKSLLPAESQFLMLGSLTKPLANGTFVARDFPANATSVRVNMESEIKSFEKLYLITEDNTIVATLTLDPYNTSSEKKKWLGTIEPNALRLTNTGTQLGLTALLYSRDSARSTPEELVQVHDFSLSVQPDTGDTYTAFPESAKYPQHQVVQAELNKVTSVGSDGELIEGNKQLIAEFHFEANELSGSVPAVEHLSFTVDTVNVAASSWYVGLTGNPVTSPCAIDGVKVISCLEIPSQIGAIDSDGVNIQLYANLVRTGKNASIQASLLSPGTIGANGAVRWTDGVGHYTWIHVDTPVAQGMKLTRTVQ